MCLDGAVMRAGGNRLLLSGVHFSQIDKHAADWLLVWLVVPALRDSLLPRCALPCACTYCTFLNGGPAEEIRDDNGFKNHG